MMPEVAANGQFSGPIDILVPFSSAQSVPGRDRSRLVDWSEDGGRGVPLPRPRLAKRTPRVLRHHLSSVPIDHSPTPLLRKVTGSVGSRSGPSRPIRWHGLRGLQRAAPRAGRAGRANHAARAISEEPDLHGFVVLA